MRKCLILAAVAALLGCAENPLLQGEAPELSLTRDARAEADRQSAAEALQRERADIVAERAAEQRRFEELDQAVARLTEQVAQLTQMVQARLGDVDTLRQDLAAAQAQLSDQGKALRARAAAAARLDRDLAQVKGFVDQARTDQAQQSAEDEQVEQEAKQLLRGLDEGQAFGVHLVTFRQREASLQGWRDLVRDHQDLFQGLQPRVETVTLGQLGGEFYRLVAGPFSNANQAADLCRRAETRGLFCEVRAFRGDPLDA
ncbi:MAG: hypothetical protein ACFB22_03600 [Rhodothalassiaceae bacterium]